MRTPSELGRSRADPDLSLDVLLVAQPTSYGVAVYVRQLTEAGVAAGHRVTVACPGPNRGPLAGWVVRAGGRHEQLDMRRAPGPRDLLDLWSLRRLARGRDVVHLHSSKAAALGRVATASLGRRRPAVVVTPHYWSWLVGGKLGVVYRWIERLLANRCDVIVAVSSREAAEGRMALTGGTDRIRLIQTGVDRQRFSPAGAVADRDPDRPLIVCVGRLSHQKGQDIAIRSLTLMRHPTAVLRLVGEASTAGQRERLEALAGSLGVADRVEWRGEASDIGPEVRAADVVIAPSRWEGMSLVYLEAMACGAAMVVSDVAGSEALDGVASVVPPEDAGALAGAVSDLLDDTERRRELARAARERSRAYDVGSMLRQNLDLWAEVAAGARSPAPRRAR